jgi:hypothetical protein
MCDDLFDKRIDQLTAAALALDDLLPFYDVSNPGTKKTTIQALLNYLAPVGGLTAQWVTTTPGPTINVPALVGKSIKGIFLPGGGLPEVITIGVPDPSQILFDDLTGDLTAGNDFVGEKILIQYS